MKKNTAIRLAKREARIEILQVLLPLIPYPVMVQENGRTILSNSAWKGSENTDFNQMQEIGCVECEEDDELTLYVPRTKPTGSSGDPHWEQSAQELRVALSFLVKGVRKPITQFEEDDPLADVKREYNAALETVEHMISVSRLF